MTSRPIQLAFWSLRAVVLSLLAGISAAGADTSDPFGTGNLVAPSQAASLGGRHWGSPCGLSRSEGASLSLTDVVERSLCNNPQTREAWANARAQAAQVGVGEAAYLPSISATGSLTRNETDGRTANQQSASLALTYLLYDFGARDATLENARQVLAAANAAQDATIQAVFLSAVQAYYQLFATQAAVHSAREAEKSSLESFNAAAARYGVGAGTPADKLQAQTAYSQAVLNRIQAEGDNRNAQGVLANVMGLDANELFTIAPPPMQSPEAKFENDIVRLINEARQSRPDLAAAEAQVKAAQANVDAVKASGLPSISLSGNLSYGNSTISDPFHNSAIGVAVSIPLFTGFNTTYRTRAAQAQVDVRGAQRDRLSLQVALDVWKAYQNLTTVTQSVKSSTDLVTSAAQSERVALGRYKAGVGNILDVLTAQSALASARQQNIQALYGWYIARATLAQAMGQLDLSAVESAKSGGPSQ